MPKFSANLSFLFTDLPFLDRFAAAAAAGFRAVEYMSPYEHDRRDIAARLAAIDEPPPPNPSVKRNRTDPNQLALRYA